MFMAKCVRRNTTLIKLVTRRKISGAYSGSLVKSKLAPKNRWKTKLRLSRTIRESLLRRILIIQVRQNSFRKRNSSLGMMGKLKDGRKL